MVVCILESVCRVTLLSIDQLNNWMTCHPDNWGPIAKMNLCVLIITTLAPRFTKVVVHSAYRPYDRSM
jgi:hypothetical protein